MGEGDVFTFIGMLIVFVAVLFLAYLTTKILGRKMAGGLKNKTMKIMETLPIGMDRCLYLIKVGKQYFLFNASRKNLQMVSEIELDENSLESQDPADDSSKVFDFKRIFESYSGLTGHKTSKTDDVGSDNSIESEGKTKGILGSISKLQKITQGKESYKG